MSKKVYTEKDIYKGMVLECIKSGKLWFTVGEQYVVDKDLFIYDDYGDSADYDYILDGLNYGRFKVVEPEEEQDIVQLFKYTFGLKTGDVKTTKYYACGELYTIKNNFNENYITIPAYNTQQAIEYLTNELEYNINDIVSLEVK